MAWFALGTILLAILTGCAGDPSVHADTLAQPAGLQLERTKAGPFLLTAYVRITRTDLPLNLYIEGDGLAWRSRYEPSTDPTPRKALGLTLAAADNSANVVYLARPCQFTPMADNPACDPAYWTSKRFAPKIVAAMNDAVGHYLDRLPGQRVNLVGYSGGGAIAVLVAARRHDVSTLRTVAGNLDQVALNRWHKVSPMPDSLNAIDVANRVADIPQFHFSGSADTVVPTQFASAFVQRAGACAHVKVLPGLSHEGNWAAVWPELLKLPQYCGAINSDSE
ncbi:alpha/beta hydrolase [Herbaspirillum sp. WKF16]|uniref:alpha/beta hydrolase n=1 Tax=Herbaspirillum sp. WKF16 TaxID=3028312 RepID=UPI0023A9AC83|nr:alpha/beta hydrolase [Herbaspirillum sp. WKF16]WDZ95788.1 alpha/beta hydrolase [Herbaspirillum sp. WKF16]